MSGAVPWDGSGAGGFVSLPADVRARRRRRREVQRHRAEARDRWSTAPAGDGAGQLLSNRGPGPVREVRAEWRRGGRVRHAWRSLTALVGFFAMVPVSSGASGPPVLRDRVGAGETLLLPDTGRRRCRTITVEWVDQRDRRFWTTLRRARTMGR